MPGSGSAVLDIHVDHDAVPLRWLLDRPPLGLLEHHLPDPGLEVAWAHAIELDDPSPWLPDPAVAGRGLVLSTGLRLPRTKQGQEAYVAALAEAGVAGLGLGTGLRWAAVPFAVVGACRARGIALLEVPLTTPFLAVTQALADQRAELRRRRLSESVAAQQRITRAAVRRGPRGAVAELARALQAGALVASADGVVTAREGVPARAAAEVARQVADAAASESPGAVSVVRPGWTLEVQPLGAGPGDLTGWLAVLRPQPLRATERLVVSHAVGVLSLEMSRPRAAEDAPLRAAALRAVLEGRAISPQELLDAAGLDDRDRLSLVGLRSGSDAGVRRALATYAERRALLDTRHAGGLRLALVESAGVDALLALLPRDCAAVVSPPASPALLPALVLGVAARVEATAAGEVVRLAAEPVALAAGDPSLRLAVEPWVRALREYDDAHDADLVRSLAAYLRHHGTWDPAAQELGVHRHTVRHRVARAAEVAGFDLDDARQRALLTLALADG